MFAQATRRQVLCVLGALFTGWFTLAASAQVNEPSEAQRTAFKQAYALAANQGGDSWRTLASGLHDYVLYPYLPYAALEHDIRQLDRATVEAYLKQYPGMIPADQLRRDFLLELARRKDWNTFLTMYQPGLGNALSCDALQAHVANGEALDFQRDLATLWTEPGLPSACDPVLQAAHDQGLLTTAQLWTRIDLAVDAGRGRTVAGLAAWLPDSDRDDANQLALALQDPSAAVAAAASWSDTPRRRQAVTLALSRLARRQSDNADAAWQQLQSRFTFSTSQRNQILRNLALFKATDFTDDALSRLIALPPAAQTDSTREWRVRLALAQQNWTAVLAGIDAMPADQQSNGEWQYFRARALGEMGRQDEARQLYTAQAGGANFFGFLAADQLHQSYAICPLHLADDRTREQALLANRGLQRAFELYAVGMQTDARREWARALKDADQDSQRVAANIANRRGWYDRAVYTFSSGDGLRIYDLRFPLASQDGLVPQAQQAGIEPAWAYGILRAESAWRSDAHSGADARGLMQLLPDTGAAVAQRHGLNWAGGNSLYDPATNIALGTRYLAEMAARFNGSPWLASAAYNAGPNRVDQWLDARRQLAPDLFVATIPFKETREYVARVMAFSVIYDWRLHGDAMPLATRMAPITQPFVLPDANTTRRPVDCPMASPVSAASAASTASP